MHSRRIPDVSPATRFGRWSWSALSRDLSEKGKLGLLNLTQPNKLCRPRFIPLTQINTKVSKPHTHAQTAVIVSNDTSRRFHDHLYVSFLNTVSFLRETHMLSLSLLALCVLPDLAAAQSQYAAIPR